MVEGLGAQAIISSILPATRNNNNRNRQIHQVNEWLQGWCNQTKFGFFDHGMVYSTSSLLIFDGMPLSQRGIRVLAREVEGLINRAFS